MSERTAALLCEYVADALRRDLPDRVVDQCNLHVLDTIAAAVSGGALPAGARGRALAAENAADKRASVWGTSLRTSVPLAALTNAMAAHADETDDSHGPSRTHPGCSIVPATLAIAEENGRSGADVVRAVVLGYDICTRFPRALWPTLIERGRDRVRSTHAAGGLFGSAMAVASLRGFSTPQVRHVLSYAVQQLSGIRTYFRDRTHVEKAFVFAGMPAFHAMMATEFVHAGWDAGDDPLTGDPNLFDLGTDPDPAVLTDGLGSEFAITATKFKKYPVASPVQSPLDGLLTVLRSHRITSDQVAHVRVEVPTMRLATVKDRPIADVNIDFLLGVALEHSAVPFDVVHDPSGFEAWLAHQQRDDRITVVGTDALPSSHAARVSVRTLEGETFACEVPAIPGSPDNPMTRADVETKARDLMLPHLGDTRTEAVISEVRRLHEADDIGPLVRHLTGPSADRVRSSRPHTQTPA